MTRKETLTNLEKALRRRRDELRGSLQGWSATPDSLLNPVASIGDRGSDTATLEINTRLAEAESKELEAIDAALECAKDGQYGLCGHCGQNIPLNRLQAIPYSTMCVRCQRKADRNS